MANPPLQSSNNDLKACTSIRVAVPLLHCPVLPGPTCSVSKVRRKKAHHVEGFKTNISSLVGQCSNCFATKATTLLKIIIVMGRWSYLKGKLYQLSSAKNQSEIQTIKWAKKFFFDGEMDIIKSWIFNLFSFIQAGMKVAFDIFKASVLITKAQKTMSHFGIKCSIFLLLKMTKMK